MSSTSLLRSCYLYPLCFAVSWTWTMLRTLFLSCLFCLLCISPLAAMLPKPFLSSCTTPHSSRLLLDVSSKSLSWMIHVATRPCLILSYVPILPRSQTRTAFSVFCQSLRLFCIFSLQSEPSMFPFTSSASCSLLPLYLISFLLLRVLSSSLLPVLSFSGFHIFSFSSVSFRFRNSNRFPHTM